MKVDLAGKIAIVTGAGRGIGKAIALALARANAGVVVNDIDLKSAKETAKEIEALRRKALPVRADVSIRKEVEQMVECASKVFRKIDVLVNNAG